MMSLRTTSRRVQKMNNIKREDYKAIKRMNRTELSAYLQRVWRRGFDAGVKSITSPKKPVENVNAETTQPVMQSAT